MSESHTTCPSCGSDRVRAFFEMREMPTYVNFLWKTAEEARSCPRGDIVLGICHVCGLITNIAFDPDLLTYREGYENSLHYSRVFQDYAVELADRLIADHSLRGKQIIEIGCGRGDFLWMLCERGDNRGTGFDPSHPDPPEGSDDRLTFVRDYYSDRYADYECDFVCSRHTLEHVPNPSTLLRPLRLALGDRTRTAVFFEVPNGLYTIRHRFLWDIIYEHTSYFTDRSLRDVFERSDFRVDTAYETFGGQYLCVEAHPGNGGTERHESDIEELIDETAAFDDSCRRYVKEWSDRLDALRSPDKRVVVWGAGSKGITFLNMFQHSDIEYAIDLNPNKHGMYIAGSGQRIVPPEFLKEYAPAAIVVVNPLYASEIEQQVNQFGLTPEFLYL